MADANSSSRCGRIAVAVLSGGVLLMIWSAVWFEALQTGRAAVTGWKMTASQVGFFVGAAAAVGAFVYLKARRLSVLDGRPAPPRRPADPSKPPVRRQLQL